MLYIFRSVQFPNLTVEDKRFAPVHFECGEYRTRHKYLISQLISLGFPYSTIEEAEDIANKEELKAVEEEVSKAIAEADEARLNAPKPAPKRKR
jgi:hypothetical protein